METTRTTRRHSETWSREVNAPKGRVEAKVARLRALRDADAAERVEALRRALRDSSNYVVAKAAEVAADAADAELVPDLLGAYDGYFGADAAERDPQVWAKNAIARALRELGHRDPAPFVRGLHHVQLEAVWAKRVDMAPNLRCICAQALVDTDLPAPAALRELLPHLVDPVPVVRVEAVNAIAQIGGDEAVLLIRLKAHAGDVESEVTGACFAAIVEREPSEATAFIAPFLDHDETDVCTEAAVALAQSRDPNGLDHVRAFLRRPLAPDVRAAVVTACAGSTQPDVIDLLLEVVRGRDHAAAESAVRAIAQSRFREMARARTRDAVAATCARELALVFASTFGAQTESR